jgi:hypothetical protein
MVSSKFLQISYVVALMLVMSLAACTNLRAVRDFAAISTQGQSMQSAAAELSDSPQRESQYALDDATRQQFEISALNGKTNELALVAAYGVLQTYMATLATLAGDGIIASNNAIADFNKQLASQHLIADTNALDAYSKISQLVSKAITDLYRQSKLREIIGEAHESVPTVVSNLEHIITVDCVEQLNGEERMLDAYYIDHSKVSSTNTPPWAKTLVMEIYRDKRSTLEGKIHDCEQFGIVLSKIAAGHEAMFRNLKHLDAKELESTLKGYQQEISAAYDSIKKLK